METDIEMIAQQKELVRQVVDNALFPAMLRQINAGIAVEMMKADNSDEREKLFFEGRAMARLEGRLVAIANEVRHHKHLTETEKARVDALKMEPT